MTNIQVYGRRLVLVLLSLCGAVFMGLSLFGSATLPQSPTLLDLSQTDLMLQAATAKPKSGFAQALKGILLPSDPQAAYSQALESYLKLQQRADDLTRAQLDLRIGILHTLLGKTIEAEIVWLEAKERSPDLALTAETLRKLWQGEVIDQAESTLEQNLDRWSRSYALEQLYGLKSDTLAQAKLLAQRQEDHYRALVNLAIATAVPIGGSFLGSLVWLALILQCLLQPDRRILSWQPHSRPVSVITPVQIWQAMVLWFSSYVVISSLLPWFLAASSWLQRQLPLDGAIYQALFGVFLAYCLTMAPMIPIIKSHLPGAWQAKFNSWPWLAWGLGGYLAAVPLVLISSSLSERLWQGNGGSNPLLPILSEGDNLVAKLIFWLTLAVAAPLFEEYLFRGFFLASLRQVMAVPWAILGSAFAFALVHLNLGDLIPLTTLGIVLGFVYHKSQNLLAPMLIHCLWNSGSLISILALAQI
ncbi:MAG: type II CAAX endopeptidase family protein [Pseudanabaenaceae cyanobacterium bins.68]|nr:type II CAAX endopeptidase family protein [Pseudanabaenaceae cyanobacterium bins.68]